MEAFAKLLSAAASLAWPILAGLILFLLRSPIRRFVDSWVNRKVTVKIAGNEFTIDELSEIQRVSLADVQAKLVELEKRFPTGLQLQAHGNTAPTTPAKRILWVDDQPKNNSFLITGLQERGVLVDTALDSQQALETLRTGTYDLVISDMARPGNNKAGIDLVKHIRRLPSDIPFFIFCGPSAARNLEEEAIAAGANGITSSGTSLWGMLPINP